MCRDGPQSGPNNLCCNAEVLGPLRGPSRHKAAPTGTCVECGHGHHSPIPLPASPEHSGYADDPAQARAVEALQACFVAVEQGCPTQGIYLWGPVGRGKTWLMDQFHRCLCVSSRRQHFHHFMAWVHQRLFQLNGTADPLLALARELAGQIRVLCFDELFVNDIGDAIILGRLFQVLFDQGVVIVATSNQPPDHLYRDGFNRERFLPAIAAIERHMQVLPVAGEQDHRLHPGAERQRYWVAATGQASPLGEVFCQLSPDHTGTDQLGYRLQAGAGRAAQRAGYLVPLHRPVRTTAGGHGIHGTLRPFSGHPGVGYSGAGR